MTDTQTDRQTDTHDDIVHACIASHGKNGTRTSCTYSGRPIGCRIMIGGAENAGVENAGAYRRGGKCRSGKCRSDKVWKAIRKIL